MRRLFACSLLLLAVLALLAPAAGAHREASPEELAALETATYDYNDAVAVELVDARIATGDRWATAVVIPIPYPQAATAVYKKSGATSWRVVFASNEVCFGPGLTRKGMSRAVARDLEIEDCPKPSRRAAKMYVNRSVCGILIAFRPREIGLSCDGTFLLRRIRWIHYGGKVATARARAFTKGCDPSCANGRVFRPRARVRLYRPTMCEGRRVYAKLRYRLRGRIPDGFVPAGTYRLLPEGGC